MAVFKFFTSLLLPSTFFFIFIVLGTLLTLFKKKGGKTLLVFGVLFYFLFSITPVSDLLLSFLESKYERLSVEDMSRADTVVLLLGGREANVLRGSEVLRISHLSGHSKTIIISGTDPLLPASNEAVAVRNFFVHRGIPEENILIEGDSRNTRENVANVKEMIEEDSFFLVTSAYHMDRSLREFKRFDIHPIPAPTDFKRKGISYRIFDFIPHSQGLKNSDTAVHEYLGAVYYRLFAQF